MDDGDVASTGDVLPALPDDASPELKRAQALVMKRRKELDDREARLRKQEAQYKAMMQKFQQMQQGASAAGTVPTNGGCCTVS